MKVSIHSIIHDFVLSHVFFGQDAKKVGEILPFQKSQIRIFLDDAQTVRSIWAFGRQLRPLESTRCMAYMAWAAWRARGFPFPIIWIIWWLIRMNNQWIWTNRQLETSWNIYTSNLKTIENHFKFLPSLRPPPPGRNLEARSGPWRSGWCSDFYAHWQSSSTSVLKLFPFLLGFFSCIPMWSPLPVNNLHIFPAYRMTVRWLMHVFLVCCGTHSVCFVPRKARPEKSRKHDLDDHGSWVYRKKVWKWRSSTEKLIQTPFKMCPGRAVSIW